MKKFLSLLVAVVMLLTCSVSALAEFPKLDSSAAWDFIGDWFGVSGMDVMGDPTSDYPELKLNLYLNGLGDLYLDGGKKEIVGWYVEDGYVFLARTVDNIPQEDDIFAYAYKNETGRLVVDLGYCAVVCEQEGEEYMDATWPEFDAEDAKYFIGAWKAAEYLVAGESYPAEAMGEMIFVLNDDGTALSIEGEEEPYELRWYSDYAVAYIGENPLELYEISFDGQGNISVKLDAETTVIMAPTEYDPNAAAAAEAAETGTILGTWESSDRTVEITEDGKLKLVYKEDGYTNHMQWEIVEGVPTVTLGTWNGSTIEFVDGFLIINYSVQQKLTRVGEVPDIYVGPGGFVVSDTDASAAFLGNWVEDDGRGVLTFNEDFTAVMNFTDGRVYDLNWKTTEDGAIFTSGMWFDTAMVIEDENTLNIGGGWMILYREGTQDSDDEMPVAQPIGAEGEAYFGTWEGDMFGMEVTLTLNQDGTVVMDIMGEADTGVWFIVDGKANVMDDEVYIDGDGNLVYGELGLVFTKLGAGETTGTDGEMSEEEQLLAFMAMLGQMEGMEGGEAAAPSASVDYVPSVADDFIGGWICKDDPNVQLLLLDGEANLIDGDELYTVDWTVVDGAAGFDGMKLYIQEDWSTGILDMYGDMVTFERGYVEKPKATADTSDASDASGEDEMSEEELLLFLELLAAMDAEENSSELAEHLQPYVGTWHMVYMATGGMEGDLRSAGYTATLELKADGTGVLSGIADDSGNWYDDEGTVRFGQGDAPLVLLDGGFLRYGNQLAGYMIFSQDETAVYTHDSEVSAPAAPAAPEAPEAPADPAAASGYTFATYEDYMDIQFVATTYTSFGTVYDASALGAEYTVIFHADGSCEFVMAGFPMGDLTWGLKQVALGLTQIDAFVISYGMDYNFIPTETGFDIDFAGTMTLHFVPAE